MERGKVQQGARAGAGRGARGTKKKGEEAGWRKHSPPLIFFSLSSSPSPLSLPPPLQAGWAKAEAEWKAAHPNGYKGMDKAGRRLAGAKHAVVDEAGEAVALKMKKGKAAIDGEAVMKHAKATKVVTVGEAVLGGGKHHKGRLLLGGKHAVVDEAGEAIVIVKAKKAHKTAVVGEAALGKHKGRLLLGGKHAVDGEAGEALLTPVIKAPKVHKVKLAKVRF